VTDRIKTGHAAALSGWSQPRQTGSLHGALTDTEFSWEIRSVKAIGSAGFAELTSVTNTQTHRPRYVETCVEFLELVHI